MQDPSDGMVKFAGEGAKDPQYDGGLESWRILKGGWEYGKEYDFRPHDLAEDRWTAIVTKECFLLATVPWYQTPGVLLKYSPAVGDGGVGLMKYCGEKYFLIEDALTGEEKSISREGCLVEPVKDEDKILREAIIYRMASTPKPCGVPIIGICEQIYDAVAAGKIPGLYVGGK